jgi:hypothetical protein
VEETHLKSKEVESASVIQIIRIMNLLTMCHVIIQMLKLQKCYMIGCEG